MFKQIFVLLLLTYLAEGQCNHKIFCNSKVLQAAADSNLFPDSKTFVDLTLKVPVEEALSNFKTMPTADFFKTTFHFDPELLLTPVQFADFRETPALINTIQDVQIKKFASQLNRRWNLLGKRVNLQAASTVGTCKEDCSSYLPQMHNKTMLVPGGRFRESYYWDSYWIVLGLIATDMLDTAENLINNFARIIQIYGFIPNGLRQYYLTRSQPPFLFMMVRDLAAAFRKKGDSQRAYNFEYKMYDYLVNEHGYWETTHQLAAFIGGEYYDLNQYRANTTTPRPQSYRQDVETAGKILNPDEKARIWKGLSSMAQSGWDFSSRWLQNSSLTTTVIDKLIPSDLNALLGMLEQYLAKLSQAFPPHYYQVNYFTKKYIQRVNYFKAVKKNGRFPDFQFDKSGGPDLVYPTDFMPFLLLGEKTSVSSIYQEVVNPQASVLPTGQQWDSPNVWAPNNWIIHEVAENQQAKKYATQWVQSTYCSYKKYNALYEKYTAYVLGQRGKGGEYAPQIGFGWTNGLALHYLSLYPDIKVPSC